MTPRLLNTPEWMVTVGGGVCIFALAVSAVFVPEIRWLHVVQALMYVVAMLLTIRRNRWGHYIGASTAGLWNYLATFASRCSRSWLIARSGQM
jgi:hypothetical protein